MHLVLSMAVLSCAAALSRAEPPAYGALGPAGHSGSGPGMGQRYDNGYPGQGRDEPMFTHEQDFTRGDGVIWGEWSVLLPDGRTQKVRYDADQDGFHPTITFEEPANGGYGNGGGAENSGYGGGASSGPGYGGSSNNGGGYGGGASSGGGYGGSSNNGGGYGGGTSSGGGYGNGQSGGGRGYNSY